MNIFLICKFFIEKKYNSSEYVGKVRKERMLSWALIYCETLVYSKNGYLSKFACGVYSADEGSCKM